MTVLRVTYVPRYTLLILLTGIFFMPVFATLSLYAQDDTALEQNLSIHVVQRDETLFRIALNYDITVDELATLNGIANPSSIFVGQRLLVPADETSSLPQTHVVERGETLASIAELYGVDVNFLVENNTLADPNRLFVGQVIQITPVENSDDLDSDEVVDNTLGDETTSVTSNPTGVVLHTVQAGETLFRIAQRYGLTTFDVANANNISDPTRIFAGQQLIIPDINLPQMTFDLPTPLTDLQITPQVFVEGQSGSITLKTSEPTTISAQFLARDYPVISTDNGTTHYIVVGVPIFTTAGIYDVILDIQGTAATQFRFSVAVLEGGYGTQNLTISDELAELLAPAVEEYEIGLLTQAASAFTQERWYGTALSLPAAAAMNSPYGTRRSYNGGEVNRYHNGADFATAPGTPIYAAADGTVVLADLLNIRGNAVVIDHGWGVFTTYSHLNEIYVTPGERIVTGQIVGLSGSTGRVTGAHLHWEVWVNGVAVDPMQWVLRAYP
jgi:murein DD-endopeptidase MepM/ murein hydrolase activator NlpD